MIAMFPTPTPHISAKPGDFGKTVLMPGDPLRSKFIAENFLENPVLVNNVRGVQGYTGTYKGVKVSVMASGIFCPQPEKSAVQASSKTTPKARGSLRERRFIPYSPFCRCGKYL